MACLSGGKGTSVQVSLDSKASNSLFIAKIQLESWIACLKDVGFVCWTILARKVACEGVEECVETKFEMGYLTPDWKVELTEWGRL